MVNSYVGNNGAFVSEKSGAKCPKGHGYIHPDQPCPPPARDKTNPGAVLYKKAGTLPPETRRLEG